MDDMRLWLYQDLASTTLQLNREKRRENEKRRELQEMDVRREECAIYDIYMKKEDYDLISLYEQSVYMRELYIYWVGIFYSINLKGIEFVELVD
jgi:hypothetical protein